MKCPVVVGSWSRGVSMVFLGTPYVPWDIDRLVDAELGHDVSRYSVGVLVEAVRRVVARRGEGGLCCLVLHHYLGRPTDILAGRLAGGGLGVVWIPRWACLGVARRTFGRVWAVRGVCGA